MLSFDGHNDTLLRMHKDGVGPGGFLAGDDRLSIDLPRARAGGLAAGIFAIFTPSPGELTAGWGSRYAPPVDHATAASLTETIIALAGEVAAASDGDVTIVHDATELDAAHARGGLGVSPAHRGRGGGGARPDGPRGLVRGRAALARPGVEPGERVRPWRPVSLPLDARPRARPHRRGEAPGRALQRARHGRRPQPPQRGGLLGRRADLRRRRSSPRTRTRTRCRRPAATSPTRSSTRSPRRAGSSGSTTPRRSCAPTAPTTPTRRWPSSRATPATSPSASASSTSAWAPTTTARRCRASCATSAGCRVLEAALRDEGFGDAELELIAWGNWRRVLGATWR